MKNKYSYKKIWGKILKPDEEIKLEFGVGRRYIKISSFILGAIFFLLGAVLSGSTHSSWGWIVFLIVFLIILIRAWYLKIAYAYGFSNKRVLIYKGWLTTSLISIDYHKITDITVREPFIDRLIYKTGKIAVNTAGTTFHEVILDHVERPYEVKKQLDIIKEEKNA